MSKLAVVTPTFVGNQTRGGHAGESEREKIIHVSVDGQISPHLNLLEALECPHDGKLSEDLDLLPVVQVSRGCVNHIRRSQRAEKTGKLSREGSKTYSQNSEPFT